MQEPKPIPVDSEEGERVRAEFDRGVNMTPRELEAWLETDASKAAGQDDGGESVGHRSGRAIVAILRKGSDELTDRDVAHMKKVNGSIARHVKQRPDRPDDELEALPWTHSLRNWGHDPLK